MNENVSNQEMVVYLAEKCNEAIICRVPLFAMLAREHLRMMPLLHAVAFRNTYSDGHMEEGILIDYDQYKTAWSEDYTDLIPYEVEHEAVELWYTRGKKDIDPFGPDHYLAVRAAMKKAFQEGKMDRYVSFRREIARYWRDMGDDHAMEELGFYTELAEELRAGK